MYDGTGSVEGNSGSYLVVFGSIEGSTGQYMMVLGQYRSVLVDTLWYWVSMERRGNCRYFVVLGQ